LIGFGVFVLVLFYVGYGYPHVTRPSPHVRVTPPAHDSAEQAAMRLRNLHFEMEILLHPSQRLIETTVNRVYETVRDGGGAAARVGERVGPRGEVLPVFAIPAVLPGVEIVGSPGVEQASLADALAGRADLAISLHGTFWADLRLSANTVDFAQPTPGACITVRSLSICRPGSPESARAGSPRAGRLCWLRDLAGPSNVPQGWVFIR
jgi:hypothetical protein